MTTQGLHPVVVQNLVKGVPLILGGSAAQVRAVDNAINKDTDNQPFCRYHIALYVPAPDVPVFRRQQRSVLVITTKPITTMVCTSLDTWVFFFWFVHLGDHLRFSI